jgi:salicylate synthase
VRKQRVSHYHGVYDPLATFARLRAEGLLGSHAYLHMSPHGAEIGWSPLAHLQLGTRTLEADWRSQVEALAHEAAADAHKTFGFIAFDAVDGLAGASPDGLHRELPLVDMIVPGEIASFRGDRVTHSTARGYDLQRYLTVRPWPQPVAGAGVTLMPVAATDELAFTRAVASATGRIRTGEIHKVVLSRFVAFDVAYDPLALFAAHCLTRPFVDAFLLLFGDATVIVTSPEVLLAARNRHITTNPLAGTRRRGKTIAEDEQLRTELKLNHKEIVEHVLSVTTMLGELEPICEPDSLVVKRLMDVSLQQRVQHLSSVIHGNLVKDCSALDALWAVFPSVTVAGFPKEAAIRAIRELESGGRGVFAGAIGWVGSAADCRFSLAIRGIYRYGARTFVHAGAGIMAESAPAAELAETEYKLSAMREALARTLGTLSP